MDRTYLPVLLLFGVAILAAAGMLAVSALTVRARPTPEKQTPYESGIPPLGDARERFSVKFYMVAMLFIIFDIEVVFLYPWAVSFRELGIQGFVTMLIFIIVLLVGFIYVWRKGALEGD